MSSQNIYQSGEYAQQHTNWHAEDSLWKAEQILNMLKKNSIKPSTIADVGCGGGLVISEITKNIENARGKGYDISSYAINLARPLGTSRLTFTAMDFFESEDRCFDLLMAIDVFEHVEDYVGFLRGLRGRATYYVFHIPLDLSVQDLLRGSLTRKRKNVGHLHYFTKATALETLLYAGYQVVDTVYTRTSEDLAKFHHWGMKSRFANLLRRALFPYFPDHTATFLGGYSLLVLARSCAVGDHRP